MCVCYLDDLQQRWSEALRPEIILEACRLIQKYNGEFSYFDIGRCLSGSPNAENQPAMLLAVSTICHNIPYYKNGECLTRELHECLQDVITFYNANKDESEIVFISNDAECYDLLSGYTLPKLAFGDDTHSLFKSGSGNSRPDLMDAAGHTYEVKRNYRNGSRASLHKADYLIDCLNTTIEIRKISHNGSIDFDHYPVARFTGFLSEKIKSIKPADSLIKTGCPEIVVAWLTNGELIPEVEKLLAEEGFKWNP